MKNNKKRNLLLSLILAAVCIAFLLYVDKFQHYSMLATVLKKGAIYSLVAVSLPRIAAAWSMAICRACMLAVAFSVSASDHPTILRE